MATITFDTQDLKELELKMAALRNMNRCVS